MNIRKSVLLLAAALCARAAFALTSWDADGVSGMTYLDSGRDGNYSTKDTAKLLINASEADGQTHVLFRAPEALFAADATRLAKATTTFRVTRERDYDGRDIWLQPLSAGYEAAETTWQNRAEGVDWSVGGGDVLDGASVAGKYDAEEKTLSFDLLPLLSNATARAAFGANGALVRLDETTRPEDGSMMFQFPTPLHADESLQPEVFWAEIDPYEDERDFAVSYIDSRDATTVFWEQDASTVGKVILNGEDGSECRAILTMPESLAAVSPARVQSVVATFDTEMRNWKGEAIFLAPLTTGTWLERHPNNETSPVHGPSWIWADGSVDPDETSFVVDDVTYANAAWKTPGGDWMADCAIQGTVTPPKSGTTGKAEFDLTPLWHNDEARANLIENGAIVFLDPAEFDQVKADKRMARVNLYRPDDIVALNCNKHSWMRVTEYESLEPGASVATTYIDSTAPDRNFGTARKTLVTLNSASSGGEARALLQFAPELREVDLHHAGSVNLLVSYYRRWNGDDTVNPVALHPAATAFRLDEATWNRAATNVSWLTPGGDFLDAHVVAADSPSQSVLTFDLAPLLAREEAAEALAANGAILRMLGNAPVGEDNNGYNVNGSLSADVPVIVLAPGELAVRGLGTDAETGAMKFSVTGLDPLEKYVLEFKESLSDPDAEWQVQQVFPRSGELSVTPPEDAPVGFYRIRQAD